MARFAFITFYDKTCLGPRILSSVARSEGHESSLIIFKEDCDGKVLSAKDIGTDGDLKYEYYQNGFSRSAHQDINPRTETEKELLISLLIYLKPDVIGLSIRPFQKDLGCETARPIREYLPETKIIAGGWGPSFEPESYLHCCDGIVFGEGEEAIRDIGRALDSQEDLTKVKNFIRSENGNMIRHEVAHPIDNLDRVPFPDFDDDSKYLIENNRISEGHAFHDAKTHALLIGRGCFMNCSFCVAGRWGTYYRKEYGVSYPKIRLRSPENIIAEIEQAKNRGARYIRFEDDSFPADPDWIEQFVTLYGRKIALPFEASLWPEIHDHAVTNRLIDAGLSTVNLKVFSGNNFIRKKIFNRNCSNETLIDFVGYLSEQELKLNYDVVAFNPFEDANDMHDTFELIRILPKARQKVHKLHVQPSTPLEYLYRKLDPKPEDVDLYRWYSILFNMAQMGNSVRKIAGIVEKYGLFKKRQSFLRALLYPHLISEKVRCGRLKKKYKASRVRLPDIRKLDRSIPLKAQGIS